MARWEFEMALESAFKEIIDWAKKHPNEEDPEELKQIAMALLQSEEVHRYCPFMGLLPG